MGVGSGGLGVATGVGFGASLRGDLAGLGVSLASASICLAVRTPWRTLVTSEGVDEVDGDRLGLGHAQFPLRLNGDDRPSQDRSVQQHRDDQADMHLSSHAPV